MSTMLARNRQSITVRVEGLSVLLGTFQLGHLDLEARPGVTAILGPNGSGKTTLLRAVNGLIPSAQGSARTADFDLMASDANVRRRVAFVPDSEEMLFSELTLDQFWSFVIGIRERSFGDDPDVLIERAAELSEQLGLEPGKARMREFSVGMKRKAQLITGLIAEPDLLMIDEPQSGLDFVSSRKVRRALQELSERGATVIMSNHDLDSVARVADYVVIIRDGQIVATSDEPFASGDECERFVAGYFEQ